MAYIGVVAKKMEAVHYLGLYRILSTRGLFNRLRMGTGPEGLGFWV